MEPRWWGPAMVKARTGESSYTVTFEGGEQEVHIDDLKEYQVEEFKEEGLNLFYSQNPAIAPRDEDVEEAIVECIKGHRFNELGRIELLVKWVGWDDSYNTWEHPGNLVRCANGFLTYCGLNGIALDTLDLLPHPFEIPKKEESDDEDDDE